MTEHENHGKVIWRFIELDKKYNSLHFLGRLQMMFNLCIQPLVHVVFWVAFTGFPTLYAYFGGNLHPGWIQMCLYTLSSLQVFWSSCVDWLEMFEYQQLSTTISIWKLLTLYFKAPVIAIQSRNPGHQLFKWAAGASFLFNHV